MGNEKTIPDEVQKESKSDNSSLSGIKSADEIAAEKHAEQFGKCNCMHGCLCPVYSPKDSFLAGLSRRDAESVNLKATLKNVEDQLVRTQKNLMNAYEENKKLKEVLQKLSDKYDQGQEAWPNDPLYMLREVLK